VTPFLQFAFWFAVGAIAAGAGITLYLISAIRRVELFPSLSSAVVVSGALLLIAVRCIAWARRREKRQEAVETITIEEPALEMIGTR
jgi:hypothetical protein